MVLVFLFEYPVADTEEQGEQPHGDESDHTVADGSDGKGEHRCRFKEVFAERQFSKRTHAEV